MSDASRFPFQGPATPPAHRSDGMSVVRVPPAARFAALWLIGIGVLLLGAFAWGFAERFREGFEGGFDPMDTIVVIMFSTAAAAHIAAGVGVWRGRRWGALLGIVLAVIGLLFCVLGVLEEWFALLPLACYVGTLVVLVRAVGRPEPSAQ